MQTVFFLSNDQTYNTREDEYMSIHSLVGYQAYVTVMSDSGYAEKGSLEFC